MLFNIPANVHTLEFLPKINGPLNQGEIYKNNIKYKMSITKQL